LALQDKNKGSTNIQKKTISHRTVPLKDIGYEGISDSVSNVINKSARQPQTSVSLQALMRTGRGEFLHKTFEDMNDVDQHSATELVLIQVSGSSSSSS
jgi:hypothetical protein